MIRISRPVRSWLPAIAFAGLLVGGCSSSTNALRPSPSLSDTRTASSPSRSAEWVSIDRELRAQARLWAGTPHRLGGTTTSGIDCSALVQRIYTQSFGMDVPRTTEQQVTIGSAIDPATLQPGDLVFFRPTRNTRHVGIYLSDGEFVHASKSQGVAISRLDEPYWRSRYWTTRRVLAPLEQGATLATETEAAPPSPNRNTGW